MYIDFSTQDSPVYNDAHKQHLILEDSDKEIVLGAKQIAFIARDKCKRTVTIVTTAGHTFEFVCFDYAHQLVCFKAIASVMKAKLDIKFKESK